MTFLKIRIWCLYRTPGREIKFSFELFTCHDTQCYLSKLDRTKYNLVSITYFYATRLLINTFTKAQK